MIKRFAAGVCVCMLLVCLAGCGKPEVGEAEISADMVCVRTDGYHENVNYPVVTAITSRAQLAAYYEANKNLYSLESSAQVYGSGNEGFAEVADSYNKEFINDKFILLVLLEENSGAVGHSLKSVAYADGTLRVLIERSVPEVGTCDMAQWHMFIELPREYANCNFSVTVE